MNQSLGMSSQQRALLVGLLQEFLPGVEVWAYGSRAQGIAKPYADLDLVAFCPTECASELSQLREALEESNFPFMVDLHIWDELPAVYQDNIRANAVPLVPDQETAQS